MTAEDITAHALLTCWLREQPSRVQQNVTGQLAIPLTRWNGRIVVGIERPSRTLRHRLAVPVTLEVEGRSPRHLSTTTLAALVADELGSVDRLLERVLDSQAMVAEFLTSRAGDIDRLWSAEPLSFGESEQALLVGHLAHPTPKSRSEMNPTERRRYSPELGARFPLRWLAVRSDLIREDSALDTSAATLAERLLRDDPGTDIVTLDTTLRAVGGDRTLVPAHPYQADQLTDHPDTADLINTGVIVDLGTFGSAFAPTTSIRTLYRPQAQWQLKFSLQVSVTNSVRVTLPKELDRAVESARLAATEVGDQVAKTAPDFVLLQDPAYVAVAPDGQVIDRLSVLLRTNRWTTDGPDDVTALTTLCQDHPFGGPNRLAAIVAMIAARESRDETEVARDWFARFCDVVVRSLLRLYLDVGLCFEAHQQNTLIELGDGWPVRGVYRDSQGYFHRAAAHDDLSAIMPGIGEKTESIFPEALADERLAYYLFVNLTLGVANALGQCADEGVLLADLRRVLEIERKDGGRYPATLLDRLLDDPTWPCKANLLTRANDMDELVGDIADQSVYVTVPNPLVGL